MGPAMNNDSVVSRALFGIFSECHFPRHEPGAATRSTPSLNSASRRPAGRPHVRRRWSAGSTPKLARLWQPRGAAHTPHRPSRVGPLKSSERASTGPGTRPALATAWQLRAALECRAPPTAPKTPPHRGWGYPLRCATARATGDSAGTAGTRPPSHSKYSHSKYWLRPPRCV